MQQVVDLQNDSAFKNLGVELLAISPDPVAAWRKEGGSLGVTVPMLSDPGTDPRSAERQGCRGDRHLELHNVPQHRLPRAVRMRPWPKLPRRVVLGVRGGGPLHGRGLGL